MSPISEDELRARLRNVDPSPMAPAYAEQLIRAGQSRRRRQRWVTGLAAAAAVATLGAGALVVGDRVGRDDALPAQPTPTTTGQPTPTVTPTASPTVTLTSAPTATASPSRAPSASPTRSDAPSPTATATPANGAPVTFLHEGVRGDGESTSDWTAATTMTGPCDVDAWGVAGRHGVAERRAIRGGGGDGGADGEALFVFRDAGSAVGFMADLRAVTRACFADSGGRTRGLVEDLPGPWGEGLSLTWFPGGTEVGGGPVALAVRSGRAVAMSSSAGPFTRTDRVDPGLVRSARPAVDHLYPQLCRYTQAGC